MIAGGTLQNKGILQVDGPTAYLQMEEFTIAPTGTTILEGGSFTNATSITNEGTLDVSSLLCLLSSSWYSPLSIDSEWPTDWLIHSLLPSFFPYLFIVSTHQISESNVTTTGIFINSGNTTLTEGGTFLGNGVNNQQGGGITISSSQFESGGDLDNRGSIDAQNGGGITIAHNFVNEGTLNIADGGTSLDVGDTLINKAVR